MNRTLTIFLHGAVLLGAACAAPAPAPRAAYFQLPPNAAGVQALRPEVSRGPSSPRPPSATAYLYLPGSTVRRAVTYQIIEGMAVYQGDILLGPAHLVHLLLGAPRLAQPSPNVHYATAQTQTSHRWPGGVIPYEIDPSVAGEKRDMVDWAVAHVSAESVVKVRPRAPGETDYVVFTTTGSGCSSYVGRIRGAQPIQVGGCGVRGSVAHEIGHAAGFFHEQSRADRDSYVTIAWSEISQGEESSFEIDPSTGDIGAYDYGSIMHYSRRAFSRTGNETIIPKDPNATIGQREGLSQLDKAALAAMYPGGPSPVPTGPSTPPPAPAPVAAGFAGTYTSSRGDVTCGESGSLVNCSFPGGSLVCAARSAHLDCSWLGSGQGRAVFTRQGNGDLRGTYGNLWSSDDLGAWNLVRAAGPGASPAPPTPPGFPTFPGLPSIPGLPSVLPTSLPGWIPPPFPLPAPPP